MEKILENTGKKKGKTPKALTALRNHEDRTENELRELFVDAISYFRSTLSESEIEIRCEIWIRPEGNLYVSQIALVLDFLDEIWPQIVKTESSLGPSWLAHFDDLDSFIQIFENKHEVYNCHKNPLKKLRKHYGRLTSQAKAKFSPKSQMPIHPQTPWTNPSTSSNAVAKVTSSTATTAVNSLHGADAVLLFHTLSSADLVHHGESEVTLDPSKYLGTSTMSAENSSDGESKEEEANESRNKAMLQLEEYDPEEEQDEEEDFAFNLQYFS